MGGGHSVPNRHRRKVANISISIPQFPYPPDILAYIISQSGGYNISFVPPGDVNSVPLETPPAPTETTPPSADEDPPTWVDTTTEYSFDPSESVTTASPAPINTPDLTTPSMPTIPAYSNPTYAPTEPPPTTPPLTSAPPPLTTPPSNIPPIWQAAISAMEFTAGLTLPITSKNQMYTLYDTLQKQIITLLGNGKDPNKNIAALIYFCTVVDVAFDSFNKTLAYNYLNGKFPAVFPDSKAYSHFCMINYYSIQASKIFVKNCDR